MLESVRGNIGFVVALAGLASIGPLSICIFVPVLPTIQAEFTADVQLVQLSLSLPLVAVLFAAPIGGVLSDRYGRRPVALVSLAVLLPTALLCGLANDLATLILARVGLGSAGTCALVVARAIARDVYDRAELPKAMARYSVAPVLAILLAPVIGGVLNDSLGWRSIFFVLFLFAAGLIGVCAWYLPETWSGERRAASSAATPRGSWRLLAVSPAFWGYTWQSSLHFVTAFTFVTAMPYIVVNLVGGSAADYGLGLLFVVAALLVGVLAAEKLATSIDPPTMTLAGSVIAFVGALLIPTLLLGSEIVPTPSLLFLLGSLVALGVGFATPPAQVGIVSAVPSLAGTASGIASALQLVLAAGFSHLGTLNWSDPILALGLITLTTTFLACLASLLARIGPLP